MRLTWKNILVVAFVGLIVLLAFADLSRVPPLWWDEGWTLSVAKNWVERGHYGRLLLDQPVSPTMSAWFPNVAAIALSFKLLGVGVWQGRLVGVIFMLSALALLYVLARRLYDQKIALGTIGVMVFMSALPPIHPILNGRQVLADIPAVFYLLAGYLCFLLAWQKTIVWLMLTVLFWSIGLNVKAQPLPFWLISLLIPLGLAGLQRQWRAVTLLALGLVGSLVFYQVWPNLWDRLLIGHTVAAEPLPGLNAIMAFVPDLSLRGEALSIVIQTTLPTLFGLIYMAWRYARRRESLRMDQGGAIVRFMLFCIAASWFMWYLLLSNTGYRYLASPNFLSALFASILLSDCTDGFNWRLTAERLKRILKRQPAGWANVRVVFAITLILVTGRLAVRSLELAWLNPDDSVVHVADYLNTQTAPQSVVESYESELFFFLNRPYHYPPDPVHIELLRRYLLDPGQPIAYDPLTANPDYLVVGQLSRDWHVYDSTLGTGDFQLLKDFGRYQLYERKR